MIDINVVRKKEDATNQDIEIEAFVSYVLDLRTLPAARSALRRAGVEVTEYRSYGYLARWWTDKPYLRHPMCAFAGLAATVPGLPQDGMKPVGAMVADVVRSGGMTDSGAERKLIVAQTAGLTQLVPLMRSFMQIASRYPGLGVNYQDLYWILRNIEHPDRSVKTRSMQRLLETYYQSLTPIRLNDN